MLVKICGIDNPKIVKTVLNMGADFLGVMLTATSKRFLGIKKAMAIVEAIQKENSKPILIFRNEPFSIIESIVERIDNCIIQFQGQNHPDTKKLIKQFDTIVTFSGNNFSNAHAVIPSAARNLHLVKKDSSSQKTRLGMTAGKNQKTSFLLIDAQEPGSGKTFQWDTLTPPCFPWFLAGGLRATNVNQAIRQLAPIGVDVSSGVENNYGKKDLRLIEAFIQAAKEKT